jgi:hypothetical protein
MADPLTSQLTCEVVCQLRSLGALGVLINRSTLRDASAALNGSIKMS